MCPPQKAEVRLACNLFAGYRQPAPMDKAMRVAPSRACYQGSPRGVLSRFPFCIPSRFSDHTQSQAIVGPQEEAVAWAVLEASGPQPQREYVLPGPGLAPM